MLTKLKVPVLRVVPPQRRNWADCSSQSLAAIARAPLPQPASQYQYEAMITALSLKLTAHQYHARAPPTTERNCLVNPAMWVQPRTCRSSADEVCRATGRPFMMEYSLPGTFAPALIELNEQLGPVKLLQAPVCTVRAFPAFSPYLECITSKQIWRRAR